MRNKILRLALTVVSLIWVVNIVGFDEIVNTLIKSNYVFAILALLLFQLSLFIRTFRWKLLLTDDEDSPDFLTLLKLNYIGSFFDVFLLSGFGGDIVRVVESREQLKQKSLSDHTSVIIMDRYSGFLALFSIAVLAIPFAIGIIPTQMLIWTALFAVAGLLSPILIVSGLGNRLIARLADKFPRLSSASAFVGNISEIARTKLLKSWLTSLVFHFVIILTHFTLNLSIGANIDLIAFTIFTPIVAMTLLMPSIQGLGLRESTYAFLFAQVGAPEALGASLGLLIFGVKVFTGLLGGAVYLVYSLTKDQSQSA